MSNSLLIAFVLFATVMFFTPGPNNIMLLSSGLTYGFRRTLPHVAGVTVGFAFMIGAVGLGLGTQSDLLAPLRKLPVGLGRVRYLLAPGVIPGQLFRQVGVAVKALGDLFRLAPPAVVIDHAHQPAGGAMGRVRFDRGGQVLEPLGLESMRLAPHRQPHVRRRIALRPLLGRLVELCIITSQPRSRRSRRGRTSRAP